MLFGALLLPVVLGACEVRPRHISAEPAEMSHAAFAPVGTESRVVYDGETLALPIGIEVVGEHLVLLDGAADSMITVLRRSDGALVRTFGRRGEGPGEYKGLWSVDAGDGLVPGRVGEKAAGPAAETDQTFWIYDVGLRRLTHIDLDRDFAGGRSDVYSIHLDANATVLDPIWLDTIVVGIGFFQDGRLAHFDATGKLLRMVGTVPAGDEDVPAEVIQHAYQSRLKAKPDRTLLAVVTRHADRLEIYRPDGTLEAAADPPFGFDPRFVVRQRGERLVMATGEDLRFGYIDLATTDDRIFALFSGRTRAGFPGVANFGEYVHVYDWNGTLRRVLRLDHSALGIAVDPAGQILYTLRHDPTPAVLGTKLPPEEGPAMTRSARTAAAPELRSDGSSTMLGSQW